MKSRDDRTNHSNQMNPNNDAYWQSRGYNERPDDWEDGRLRKDSRSKSVVKTPRCRGSNSLQQRPDRAASSGCPRGGTAMKEREFVDTAPMDGLYSGRILRAVVWALDIEDEVLDSRTAQRFFSGQHVDKYNRNQIFDALGQALITRGLAPETLEDLPDTLPMASVVGMTLMMVCGEWDRLMAHIQSRSGKVADVGDAGAQLLRMVVVDLALRMFALAYLGLEDRPGPEPPTWVLENGTGNILRQHLRRAELTRDQLAARAGVSRTSVDNWLDGKNRPSADSVAALAEGLASANGRDAGELRRELDRQFSLASMADMLGAGIGRDRVIELTMKVAHFTRLLAESPELPRILGDNPRGNVRNLIMFGSAGGSAAALLSWLADREPDPGWRRGHPGSSRSLGITPLSIRRQCTPVPGRPPDWPRTSRT